MNVINTHVCSAHLKEHDLAVCPLCIGGVGEGVKDLLESDYLPSPPVHTFPHDAIGLHGASMGWKLELLEKLE